MDKAYADFLQKYPEYETTASIDQLRAVDYRRIDGKSSGAVRISVGMVTNFSDVQSFLHFAISLPDKD